MHDLAVISSIVAHDAKRRFDIAGAVTITAALVTLVYAVVEAPTAGWGSAQTLGLLALAAVLGGTFVAVESRSAAPLAPLAGTFAAQAAVTNGGVRRVAVAGLSLTGLGSLLLTQVSAGGSYVGDLFFALLILGLGIGSAFVAGSIASLAGVAETEAGLASGLKNASFQIGGAVSVAILSTAAVAGANGSLSPAALTAGYRSAFTVAIAIAVLGTVAAGLLLGRTREPVTQAKPAVV